MFKIIHQEKNLIVSLKKNHTLEPTFLILHFKFLIFKITLYVLEG